MFDAVKERDNIVSFIREYYAKNHLKGAVLGISGGKDSGVVAGLMCEAIGPENVVGITMPCHSKSRDAADAQLVAEKFGFEMINIDLTDTFDSFVAQIDKLGTFSAEEKKNADINLKPRLRMSTCYYMAALLSATKGGTYLVPGTSNLAELFLGYFTKFGDSAHDFEIISHLTVEEVIKVGEVVGVPPKVLYRTPDDGLSGQSDEEKMGVTYADTARIIRGLPGVSEEDYNKIMKLHRGSRHKFAMPHPQRITVETYPQENNEPQWLFALEPENPLEGEGEFDWRFHRDGRHWSRAYSAEQFAEKYSLEKIIMLLNSGITVKKYYTADYQAYPDITLFVKENCEYDEPLALDEVEEMFG